MFLGDPYAYKGAWIQSTNTIVGSFAGRRTAYDVFKKLEFVVVADLFLTPTAAAFADIALPVAQNQFSRGKKMALFFPMPSIFVSFV